MARKRVRLGADGAASARDGDSLGAEEVDAERAADELRVLAGGGDGALQGLVTMGRVVADAEGEAAALVGARLHGHVEGAAGQVERRRDGHCVAGAIAGDGRHVRGRVSLVDGVEIEALCLGDRRAGGRARGASR